MNDLISQFEDIKERNTSINAYISFADIEKQNVSKTGKLSGKTIAIKDTISTEGLRTTCASKMLENYVPPFDALIILVKSSASSNWISPKSNAILMTLDSEINSKLLLSIDNGAAKREDKDNTSIIKFFNASPSLIDIVILIY